MSTDIICHLTLIANKLRGSYDMAVANLTGGGPAREASGPPRSTEGEATARVPSLTQRRMARTRRQLAEVAAGLFLDRGYEAVTVEEIVAAVEVSPRTFFRYFPSKEDVLDEILVNEAEAVTAALRERPPDEPILEALRVAAYSWVGATERDPAHAHAFRPGAAHAGATEPLARPPAKLPRGPSVDSDRAFSR